MWAVGRYNKLQTKNISLVQRFLMKDFRRFRIVGDGKIFAKNIPLIQCFIINSARSILLDHSSPMDVKSGAYAGPQIFH